MKRVLTVTSCALLVTLSTASGSSPQVAQPLEVRTLVSSPLEIPSFALEGNVLGWVTIDNGYHPELDFGTVPGTLYLRALGTGRTVAVKRIIAGSTHPSDGLWSRLVLANGRALWHAADTWSNQQLSFFVRTASIDDPVVHTLPCCYLYIDESRRDLPTFPLAGSGSTLIYYAQADCGGACKIRAVYRVVGRSQRKLFDVENPTYLAVDGERIAVVWESSRRGELRTLGGKVVAVFKLERRPRAVALSHDRLAVLTHGGRVEFFSASAGSRLSPLLVPWQVAPMLAANDRWLVYAVGRAITGFDLRTGTSRVLAHAAKRPFDLTVSGRRVAWGEHLDGDVTRVRLAGLPR